MSKQPWHQGTPERDPAELAEESAGRRAEAGLEAWARKPMSYNPINNPVGSGPHAGAATSADKLPASLERALANPRRLNTPRRQQAAFLRQVPRCATIAEAAFRAGVNRGTLYRWRARDPRFAAKWDATVARHAAETNDVIALQAHTPDVQAVFYHGKQIGERRRLNTRLLIHVQTRLDADRRRAEDRAERRELMLLRAELAERNFKTRQLATLAATPAAPEMCSEDLGLPVAA